MIDLAPIEILSLGFLLFVTVAVLLPVVLNVACGLLELISTRRTHRK